MSVLDVGELRSELSEHGIDVVRPFNTAWYNAYVKEEGLALKPLASFGRDKKTGGALGILIGNSRALWPSFLSWLAAQPDSTIADPLDTYVHSIISAAVEKFAQHSNSSGSANIRHEIFWPWEKGARLVSMQRVAATSGLCYLDDETKLVIHPVYGAWVGFRAVVVVDVPADTPLGALTVLGLARPPMLDSLLSDDDTAAARCAMAKALNVSDQANLCTQLHGSAGMAEDVKEAWAALRDCVSVGREHRYSDEQLHYHYTKDKACLAQALDRHRQRATNAVAALRTSWPWTWIEVVLTLLLPIALILAVVLTAKKMPGREGDDERLHKLAK